MMALALTPAMAARAEETGVKKAAIDPLTLLLLSILAGAFISFGAIFATTVSAGSVVQRSDAAIDDPPRVKACHRGMGARIFRLFFNRNGP